MINTLKIITIQYINMLTNNFNLLNIQVKYTVIQEIR